MTDCIFCQMVAERAKAYRLLEDDDTLAFLNIAPATVGHALVIPRRHAEGLWDLGDDEHAQVARAVSRVARLLRLALMPAGLNLTHATGPEAWQTVFHFHVHVIPRYRPEELRVMWQAEQAPDGELEALQRRVLACRGQLPDG